MGNRSRTAEALASTTSIHAPHGPLHRKNDGTGEELRAADYCEEDIYQVSSTFTGIVLDLKYWHWYIFHNFWHTELALSKFVIMCLWVTLYPCIFFLFVFWKRSEMQAHFCTDSKTSGKTECIRPSPTFPCLESETGWRRSWWCRWSIRWHHYRNVSGMKSQKLVQNASVEFFFSLESLGVFHISFLQLNKWFFFIPKAQQ